MKKKASGHKWTFQKTGGLYQVALKTKEDLCNIGSLDPKLWVALSCPSSGLEFDSRTLTLLDSDKDGRIRVPDIVEAMEWLCPLLNDAAEIINMPDTLPLESISTATPNGEKLLHTAKTLMERQNADSLTQELVVDAMKHAAEQLFNGDGVLPPSDALDGDVKEFIEAAIKVTGGVLDASGAIGINAEIADAFVKTLQDHTQWENSVKSVETPFGGNTAEAWALYNDLKAKIEDYYLRCDFVAYSPVSRAAMNGDEKAALSEDSTLALDSERLAELPLSRVSEEAVLNLETGINPAWQPAISRFASIIKQVITDFPFMTKNDWATVKKGFEGYAKALSSKPAPIAAKVVEAPTLPTDKLGNDLINKFLNMSVCERFKELAAEDLATPAATADIAELEKLVLYYKHIYRLLKNFVNFEDFYRSDMHAAFEIGALYIDGRACRLCLPVDNVDQHFNLASLSYMYLLYCRCTRKKQPGTNEPEGTFNIVAAVTDGDSDLLRISRNGVYVDNNGYDWDATVLKIISNPINVRQAALNPYKRFGSMVTEQINKLAGEKQNALFDSAGKKIQETTTAAATGAATAAAPKFDIGRNVGIFAAVGLALGAIGTAVATIARALLSLHWWQLPLVFLAIFLLISGPSMIMAWMKIRQRTLSPLLEASGWAINGRVSVKYSLGKFLTTKAELPLGASINNNDIFAEKSHKGLITFIIAVIIGALLVFGWVKYGDTVMEKLKHTATQLEEAESAAADDKAI